MVFFCYEYSFKYKIIWSIRVLAMVYFIWKYRLSVVREILVDLNRNLLILEWK